MRSHRGFTLIEVLVVVAIVGVLTAIAIPRYSVYTKRAYDLRARSDLRNVATAEEAYFIDEERYLSCKNETCTELPGISRLSAGVELSITALDTSFTGEAKHARGSGTSFKWDSEGGGMLE